MSWAQNIAKSNTFWEMQMVAWLHGRAGVPPWQTPRPPLMMSTNLTLSQLPRVLEEEIVAKFHNACRTL